MPNRENRLHRCVLGALVLCALVAACKGKEGATPPADAQPFEIALAGAVVMIGAGDIARCDERGDEQTASIVDSVLKADSVANVENVVFTVGDNVYPVGSAREFESCWASSWGNPETSIMKFIRPSPGNHDYDTRNAEPYYQYFGERAGPGKRGYYSFDIGDWHVVSLNSELPPVRGRQVQARAQEGWLEKDLADNKRVCTVVYFHRPLFSSGEHGESPAVRRLWDIMFRHRVDLVVNGHDHHYERFIPMAPSGVPDSINGIEQIIVGTGGGTLRGVSNPGARNSAATVHGYYGVLKLSLGDGEYRRAFLDTRGRVWDEGGRKCH